MTTPNAELAYRALDTARAHDQLDMHSWVNNWLGAVDAVGLAELTADATCGTTACFAGWVTALAGYKVTVGGRVFDDVDDIGHVQNVAANLLGITMEQSEDLFFVGDADIDAKVVEIFGPRPAVTS